MRVLLVEDEKKVASFIKKGLEEEQYQVDVAHDGEEGLRKALIDEHDLIILPLPDEMDRSKPIPLADWMQHVLQNARCRVLLVVNPVLPTDLAE